MRQTLLVSALLAVTSAVNAIEITDMTGRRVMIPAPIERVFPAAPPVVPLLYALNPNKLMAIHFAFRPDDFNYLVPSMRDAMIIGRYTGEGPPPRLDQIMQAKPQLTIGWELPFIDRQRVLDTFQWLQTPGLLLHLDSLTDYPAALELVGNAIGETARAQQLSRYIRDAITRVERAVADIPAAERQRVYFAEGTNGLMTECADSFHAEVIQLAGGVNVMDCKTKMMCGHQPVKLADIQALDPDVILTDQPDFAQHVKTDAAWQQLRAVRNNRVLLAPNTPFNWLGRPPSFMRAIAMQWLAHELYPTHFNWNAQREIPAFYALFLGIKPEQVNTAAILSQSAH
ncbi:ABC transporter substrate-binding protein [Rhodoferax sp. 4810]|uniref:ABC transporter substrate-binding protein n=2 Tax=Thiospirillum jenense TaxID=1653858 RepID=A0A839HG75_9GAMM|nr:ABC transporter substrate-binding protein [Rhodoferax jenense]MBB1126107.1 ABC transporter substrate-binding protein [Thiospirillum jenense]